MRISDWSSDVCSADLERSAAAPGLITRPMRGVTSAGAPLPSTGILRNSFFREVQLGELVDWNVLLLGGNVADQVTLGTIGVNFVVRKPKGGYGNIAPYRVVEPGERFLHRDRESTRLNSSHK